MVAAGLNRVRVAVRLAWQRCARPACSMGVFSADASINNGVKENGDNGDVARRKRGSAAAKRRRKPRRNRHRLRLT